MPIVRELDGDMFQSPSQTFVCPVNTVGAMGKGLALAFTKQFPGLFRCYRFACKTGHFARDPLFLFPEDRSKRIALCLPTKHHWRQDSDIDLIRTGLASLVATYAARKITSIAMPALGCGEGHLEWETIQPLLYEYLHPLPIPVTVYRPHVMARSKPCLIGT